jgi:hypothetical protein
MNKNVFINCPFDILYENLFDAILFTVYFCGCKPRCALETDDGSQIRVEKIFSIIKDCDLGIHDISRTELNVNNLPRFNMPFEFGIFMGAKKFGSRKQKVKSCLIFDTERYRYQQFISDIAGQDISAHNGEPEQIIRNIRNWLNTFDEFHPLPGASAIISKYNDYLVARPNIMNRLNLTAIDVQFADKTQIISQWIGFNPF